MAVSTTLAGFALRMNLRAKEVEREAAEYTRRYASNFAREVVPATPVDTGLARSNWIASVGAPIDSPRGVISRNPAPIISAAISTFLAHRKDGVLYFQNVAGHITELNQGKSPQAAAGFIQASLIRAGIITEARGFHLDP